MNIKMNMGDGRGQGVWARIRGVEHGTRMGKGFGASMGVGQECGCTGPRIGVGDAHKGQKCRWDVQDHNRGQGSTGVRIGGRGVQGLLPGRTDFGTRPSFKLNPTCVLSWCTLISKLLN